MLKLVHFVIERIYTKAIVKTQKLNFEGNRRKLNPAEHQMRTASALKQQQFSILLKKVRE